MKQNIKIVVYDYNSYSDTIPELASEFLEFWQRKLEQIPAEYKSTAKIELDATSSYDCGQLLVEMSYLRPETDEEEAVRTRKEDRQRKSLEDLERSQLAKLKAKYDE